MHLLHELLLVVKTTSALVGLWRQAIEPVHLVLGCTWSETGDPFFLLFRFLALVHLDLGRIGGFVLVATSLVGA